MSGSASGYAYEILTDEMTLDEKIDVVQENVLRALESSSAALAAATKNQRDLERATKTLDDRTSDVEKELRAYSRRLLVDGVPMAINGLVVVGLGLLIQTLGNFA